MSLTYSGLFKKISLLMTVLMVITLTAHTQTYVVNGSASANGGNYYTLTPDVISQNGSVWSQKRIDLRYDFDLQYLVNLGSNIGGADGMAFVLQRNGNTVQGSSGSGMGYGGISPSLEVEYDSYVNQDYQAYDPPYDHLCIMKDGNYHHNNIYGVASGQLVSPVALTNLSNGSVKDGQYHKSRVIWNASSKTISVYFDGYLKFTYNSDLINTFFGGDPAVYFGFTASTGGLSNQHAVYIDPASTFHVYSPLPPPVPTISANGPTTFCQGGSVSLSSTAAKNSLQFNGSNYAEVASDPALTLTNALTVEAWVKTDIAGATQYIVSKGLDDLANGQYGILMVGGKFQFHLWQSGHQGVYGTTIIQPGVWYHVAGTWDGSTTTLYVNGLSEGTAFFSGPMTAITDPLEIGRLGKTNALYPMYGMIDEVRIWNRARTQSEIQSNKNSSVALNPSLVAYYKLDEGTGTTTADAANGNTASLINSPLWTVSGAPVNYASYAWSTGANTPTITAATTGSYYVTVTDENGNTGTSSPVTVTVNPPPSTTVTASPFTTICQGGFVTLSAPAAPGNIYSWNSGQTSPTVQIYNQGSYFVKVTDANGCTATSAPVQITVTPLVINCPPDISVFTEASTLLANYPLQTDLLDATGQQGPISVYGSLPPSVSNGMLCINGNYPYTGYPNTQNAITPNISALTENNFSILVDFKISSTSSSNMPIIIAGGAYRWLGIEVDPSGKLGIKYNNNFDSWSSTSIITNQWYTAQLSYNQGTATLYLDGSLIFTQNIGSLTSGNNYAFTPSDGSTSQELNGCIKNLKIFNGMPPNCGAHVMYSVPGVSGNCAGATVTQISGLPSGSNFPVGTTLNTFMVSNGASSATCSFNVIVTDNEKPKIKTKPVSVILVNGSGSITTSAVDNGSTDNCGIASMTLSKTNFDCSNKGVNIVTYTVTDIHGNAASANVTVTVIDASSPVPNVATLPVITGQCSASATVIPTATDGCGAIITATTTNPTVYNTQGTFTINWLYTAVNGKTTYQTQQVIVKDNMPPAIPSLPDITGECSATAVRPTTMDNCSGTVTGTTTDQLTYNLQGNYVIHWTFTDANGNISTATQNVIVKDITPPTITCPVDVSLFATSAAGAVVNYTTPVGMDNCSPANTIRTAGLADGSVFPIGTTTVTHTVTDVAGLQATCSFNVTVKGAAPVIVVPAAINVNNTAGLCSAIVNYTATETTGIPASTITYSIAPGAVFPVGTTTVTATATNAVGTSSKTFTVTVTDNEKPSFTSPGTVSISIPYLQTPISSSASVTYNFADPLPAGAVITSIDLSYTAKDQGWGYTGGSTRFYVSGTFIGGNVIPDHNVHSLSLNYTGRIPGYVYGGNNTFQFGFEGYPGWQGFFYGGTMTIHYQKTTIPVPISVNNDAGKCGASLTLTTPATYDNCSVASVTNDAPPLFPVGTTTVTWTATDIHGNSNTATQIVTVTDNEPPTITPPPNVNVNTDFGSNIATNVSLGTPVTHDNCNVATVTNDAPTSFPVGNTIVTWIVTDIHSNTATATQTVTVTDNQPPAIAALAAIVKNNDPGVCGAIVTYNLPQVSDNVSSIKVSITEGGGDGIIVFDVPVTNNVTSLNFSSTGNYKDIVHGHGTDIPISVELFNPLVNNWIPVKSIQTGSGDYHFGLTSINFPVIAQVSKIRFVASQPVHAAFHFYEMSINLNSIPLTQTNGLTSGALFPVGSTVNTFKAIDMAGNISTTSFTVTVMDAEKPVIVSSTMSSTQYADVNGSWTGSCSVLTLTDNCSPLLNVTEEYFDAKGNLFYSGASTVTQGNHALQARTFPLGINTVVLTVTDGAGNISDKTTLIVQVVDNTNPTIVPSANITQMSDPAICGAYVRVPLPVSTDNCSIRSVVNNFNGSQNASGRYPVGTTVVIWTVTDGSGNTATATQNITVTDNEPPVISNVPVSVIQTNDAGNCGAMVTWAPAMASDNCGVVSFTSDHQSGESFPLGTTTVTFTARDIHNNITTASFTITITDNEAPRVITKPVTVTLVNGSASILASDINNGSTDNCGTVTLSASKTSFSCADAGPNQIVLTVTDSYGNSSSATAVVTVIGEVQTSSIVVIPANTVYTGDIPTNLYIGYGPQSVMLQDKVTGISPVTYAWSGGALSCTNCANPVFNATAPGLYTFTVTATNQYGCSTTSTVSICVRDIRVPNTVGKVYVCHLDLLTGITQTLSLAVNTVANHLTQNPQDKLGSCNMAPCSAGLATLSTPATPAMPVDGGSVDQKNVTKDKAVVLDNKEGLSVKVSPNPSNTVFSFIVSTKRKLPVYVRLLDAGGRLAERLNNAPVGMRFEMGDKLHSGIYFAEVIQGNERVVVKLIKQN